MLVEHPVQGVVSTRDGDRLVGGLVAEHPAEGRGGPHAAAGVRAEADDGAGAGLQRGLATCTAAAVQYSRVQYSTVQYSTGSRRSECPDPVVTRSFHR